MSKVVSIAEFAPKVRLLDHAGETLEWIDAEKARRLIREGKVSVLHTRRRVRAVRYVLDRPDPPMKRPNVIRMPGPGSSHRRETWDNPRGCWHIDFLDKDMTREEFLGVLADVTKLAA